MDWIVVDLTIKFRKVANVEYVAMGSVSQSPDPMKMAENTAKELSQGSFNPVRLFQRSHKLQLTTKDGWSSSCVLLEMIWWQPMSFRRV